MSNPRAICAEIINNVCYHGMSLSESFLNTELKPHDNDHALIKEMCFGTLRFWITLQAILKELLEKPIKPEDKIIECLLCVGLYQVMYMHIPDYAIVNETVSATRVLKKSWASKLVNKILHMALEKKSNDTLKIKGITAEFAHPNWIIEKIKDAWPDDWEKILNANNQKALLFLRINETQISAEHYQKILKKNHLKFCSVSGLSHSILLEQAMPVEKIPGFYEGFFSVQDASGQKVVEYLDLQANHVVLDACAAPGSKTTHILENQPALSKLFAVDIHEKRLSKIKENIKRLKLPNKNVTLITADITKIKTWWDKTLFDRILVDAPCSASGVIRRHPDIKILRKKTDIQNLADQQLEILNALWPTLKSGGKLIYTTCSIFFDENENTIEKFLSQHKDAQIIKIENDWGVNLKYGQQVLTGDQNRDGFYYAIIQKPCG